MARRLPNTYSQENAVLAMLIDNPDFIAEASRALKPEDFSDERNRALWLRLTDMDARGEAITLDTVYMHADVQHFTANILPRMAGRLPVFECYQITGVLAELSGRRRVAIFAQSLEAAALGTDNLVTLQERIKDYAATCDAEPQDRAPRSMSECVDALRGKLAKQEQDARAGRLIKVEVPWRSLGIWTAGGLERGELDILAARPSVGKTAVALAIASFAAQRGVPVQFFSLEMTCDQIARRALIATGAASPIELQSGFTHWDAFDRAAKKVKDLPLWVSDNVVNYGEIVSEMRRAARRGECSLSVIDYLGLIVSPVDGKKLYLQLQDITGGLKRLAKSLDIPVLLLCQLNRNSVNEKRAPNLADLRDSGSIEQDADIVMMLDREGEDVAMYVRKNRNGQAGGRLLLRPDRYYATFQEVDVPTGFENETPNQIQNNYEPNYTEDALEFEQ